METEPQTPTAESMERKHSFSEMAINPEAIAAVILERIQEVKHGPLALSANVESNAQPAPENLGSNPSQESNIVPFAPSAESIPDKIAA